MFDLEREVRISVAYIGDTAPALAYWAVYNTDSAGQWQLVVDFTTDPFDDTGEGLKRLADIVGGWLKTL